MKTTLLSIALSFFLFSCESQPDSKEMPSKDTEKIESAKDKILEEELPPKEEIITEKSQEVEQKTGKECTGSLRVYLNDPDEIGTNIREEPSGNLVYTLVKDEVNFEYFITVYQSERGWFKIDGKIGGMETDIELEGDEFWMHGSVLGVDTRNYGGEEIKLFENPDETSYVVGIIRQETYGLSIVDMCGDWVKIGWENDEIYVEGWVDAFWLCGNPLTYCS